MEEEHPEAVKLSAAIGTVARQIKRIRKAAGLVRDIDVNRKLANKITEESANRAERSKLEAIHKDNEELQCKLRRLRRKLARKLKNLLGTAEVDLHRKLQRVKRRASKLTDQKLAPLEIAQRWTLAASVKNRRGSEADIHEIRKQTKIARYVAELQSDSKPAVALARRLQRVQDAIGYWHDLDLLGDVAAKQLGAEALLTQTIKQRGEAALRNAQEFLKLLTN